MSDKYIYEINDFPLTPEVRMQNETIFHNANGYLGVRSNLEEEAPGIRDSIRGAYINGFYDFAEMKQAEKLYGFVEEKQTMLNIADIQGIRLAVDGEWFSMSEGTVRTSRRYLDMEKGITGREVLWQSPSGKTVQIHTVRMASFCLLPLFTIEYRVQAVDFSGEVLLQSDHLGEVHNYVNPDDPRVAGESFEHLIPQKALQTGNTTFLVTKTAASGLTACTAVEHVLSVPAECRIRQMGHGFESTVLTTVHRGEFITLRKYCIFTDSIRYQNPMEAAEKFMKQAVGCPLENWYLGQREFLKTFWNQSSLEIEGDEELSLAVRYNLYQLIASVGKDEHCNIAAKGLSGEGYEGHYFWDTEMYIQPFFVLTNPELARNLIEYRYSTMEEARINARILGHKKGVLFPWRTIMGSECSGYYPSGTAQYHINGDIAYAVSAYYLATKDLDFMIKKGAELLIETARLWIDTGNFYKGKFVINAVTGPDEYTCMVNNNYFTNASAKRNLKWALKASEMLRESGHWETFARRLHVTEAELQMFSEAAEKMYLPYDEELGINPQDDSFLSKPVWDFANTPEENYPLLLHYHPLMLYRHQVCKQADTVFAHFIFDEEEAEETICRSFAYYEKVTTHDSSLSTCIYSIVASRLGMVDKAYQYFGDSAKLDLFNTHHNTKDGIHTANMGGTYMAVVYGFAGLRLRENGLHLRPVLPESWKGYRFRIQFEGSHIEIRISTDEIRIRLLYGAPKPVWVNENCYQLESEIFL